MPRPAHHLPNERSVMLHADLGTGQVFSSMLWFVFFIWTWFLMMPSPTSLAARICPGQGALDDRHRPPAVPRCARLPDRARVQDARLAMQPVADQNSRRASRRTETASSHTQSSGCHCVSAERRCWRGQPQLQVAAQTSHPPCRWPSRVGRGAHRTRRPGIRQLLPVVPDGRVSYRRFLLARWVPGRASATRVR